MQQADTVNGYDVVTEWLKAKRVEHSFGPRFIPVASCGLSRQV